MKVLKSPRSRAYLGLALVAAGLAGLALSGDLPHQAARFASFYGLAGAGFALLATCATSLPLGAAIVAAVVLRLIFLPGMPSLSDDYYRYVWDGRVQLAGINPYKYRPYEHALDRVPFAQRDLINHEELRTVYPPLTQAVFLGVALAARAARHGTSAGGAAASGATGGAGVAGAGRASVAADGGAAASGGLRLEAVLFKLVFGTFDLATAAAVWWLAAARLRKRAVVLYLLCPAVILQTWESAHAEAAGVFFCVLAAALLVRRRDTWAGVALGAAAAFKVTPLGLLIPALLGRRTSPGRFLLGFVPAFVIPYVPYAVTGGTFGSLFESGTRWSGGSILFMLFARFFSAQTARWLALAVFVTSAVWMARSLRGREHTAEAFAWTLTLLVLCLPVVHAWYWLTPLALGLAAGLWLPLLIGMVTPLTETLPVWVWVARLVGRHPVAALARSGVVLSTRRALAILRR